MINYKALSIFLLFIDFSWLGFVGLEHDSYKVCLGFASVILATATVCYLMDNRLLMIVFFVIFAVVFSQLSMVAREVIKNPDFRQNFNQDNTTDDLSEDIKHGFKRIWEIFRNESSEEVSEEKSGKYRYLSLITGFPFALAFIAKKEPKKRPKKEKIKK